MPLALAGAAANRNACAAVLRFVDCVNVEVCDLDLLTYDSIAVRVDGSTEDSCRDVRIHDNRMVARTNVIRATNAAVLSIASNRLHLLDTVDGLATISIQADDVLIERNTLVLLPFVERTPGQPPDDDPTRDPSDPCARPEILYVSGTRAACLLGMDVLDRAARAEAAVSRDRHPRARRLGARAHPREPHRWRRRQWRHARRRSGSGGGVGGAADGRAASGEHASAIAMSATRAVPIVNVNVTSNGQSSRSSRTRRALPDVDVLEADAAATDRSDAQGMASVKTAPGSYTLDVSAQYRVVRVTEARDEGVLVNAITVASRAAVTTRVPARDHHRSQRHREDGFVGAALRAGCDGRRRDQSHSTNDPRPLCSPTSTRRFSVSR